MKSNKYNICIFVLLFSFIGGLGAHEQETEETKAQVEETKAQVEEKIVPPNWFSNSVKVVAALNTRFGPKKTDDLYLEYELAGRQKSFDFYGYIDFPKFFGVASDHKKGIWDKGGTRVFADLQGRLSINSLLGMGQNRGGLIKEYFLSATYVGNFATPPANNSSHVLWVGAGVKVNTYSKLALDINLYARKNFRDYGSIQEYKIKGYRLKMKWIYPITSLFNKQGSLTYIGFGDYDFATGKAPKEKPTNKIGSNDALQISNALSASYKRFSFASVVRYWYHGGGNRYNGGTFDVHTTGWGCYFLVGVKL